MEDMRAAPELARPDAPGAHRRVASVGVRQDGRPATLPQRGPDCWWHCYCWRSCGPGSFTARAAFAPRGSTAPSSHNLRSGRPGGIGAPQVTGTTDGSPRPQRRATGSSWTGKPREQSASGLRRWLGCVSFVVRLADAARTVRGSAFDTGDVSSADFRAVADKLAACAVSVSHLHLSQPRFPPHRPLLPHLRQRQRPPPRQRPRPRATPTLHAHAHGDSYLHARRRQARQRRQRLPPRHRPRRRRPTVPPPGGRAAALAAG